jgi:hypothetical protein
MFFFNINYFFLIIKIKFYKLIKLRKNYNWINFFYLILLLFKNKISLNMHFYKQIMSNIIQYTSIIIKFIELNK